MASLVDRLRHWRKRYVEFWPDAEHSEHIKTIDEAAAELTRMQAELEAARVDARTVERALVAASVVLSDLPALDGYNGSILMLDDVERDRIVKDIDLALAAMNKETP